MSTPKQEIAYSGESPFMHADMLKGGHLQMFKSADSAFASIHSSQRSTPCIVFVGNN